MAAITAAMVKALREKTDAPMMECKKALTEADGDAAKAEEILRVKLGNKASKAAARVTAEGVVTVYVSEDRKVGAILEVNSETDFVAKNEEFQKMAQDAVRLVAEQNPADIAALSALNIDGKTLEEVRTALVGKIGENMTFRRFQRFEAQGALHKYVHGGSKIAAVVDVARRHGIQPIQVLLSFSLFREDVVSIPKCGSREHVFSMLEAEKVVLDEEDIALLEKSFPKPTRGFPLDMC